MQSLRMRESWRIGSPGATVFFAAARLLYHAAMTLDPTLITGYHAHIYYDAEGRETAARLRQAIGEQFDTQLGRWHDEAVGPHPISMYQVAFPASEFPKVVPWLMLNRAGLAYPRPSRDR